MNDMAHQTTRVDNTSMHTTPLAMHSRLARRVAATPYIYQNAKSVIRIGVGCIFKMIIYNYYNNNPNNTNNNTNKYTMSSMSTLSTATSQPMISLHQQKQKPSDS
jgi:hypothetical protein